MQMSKGLKQRLMSNLSVNNSFIFFILGLRCFRNLQSIYLAGQDDRALMIVLLVNSFEAQTSSKLAQNLAKTFSDGINFKTISTLNLSESCPEEFFNFFAKNSLENTSKWWSTRHSQWRATILPEWKCGSCCQRILRKVDSFESPRTATTRCRTLIFWRLPWWVSTSLVI